MIFPEKAHGKTCKTGFSEYIFAATKTKKLKNMKEMIIRIWKKWFGKETAGQVMNPVCQEAEAVTPKAEKPFAPSPMLERLEAYLFDRYDFRFNVLTEQS